MKYVMINGTTQEITLINDPVEVHSYKAYDPKRDRIYQLGSEVRVKVVVETLPTMRQTPTGFDI